MTETWRPVVGFEGLYEVSSEGRVRSHPVGRRTVRVMKQSLKGDAGHRYPGLRLSHEDGRITTHLTATLVAAAFLGPKPVGTQINHIDGERTNNRVENLEYVAPGANEEHAIRLGLKAWGERHGMHKLTAEAVLALRSGELRVEDAMTQYDVRDATAYNAKTGKTWRRLSDLNSVGSLRESTKREGE